MHDNRVCMISSSLSIWSFRWYVEFTVCCVYASWLPVKPAWLFNTSQHVTSNCYPKPKIWSQAKLQSASPNSQCTSPTDKTKLQTKLLSLKRKGIRRNCREPLWDVVLPRRDWITHSLEMNTAENSSHGARWSVKLPFNETTGVASVVVSPVENCLFIIGKW
jgi:hypothetical protein